MHVEHAAKVDHVEHIEAEIAKVVVHRLGEFRRERAGIHDPSAPRRALILVMITRSPG